MFQSNFISAFVNHHKKAKRKISSNMLIEVDCSVEMLKVSQLCKFCLPLHQLTVDNQKRLFHFEGIMLHNPANKFPQ